MLNKKSLVLSFVAFATLASCAMPTTTTKKASTDEALDVDRSIGATTASKLAAISPEVKTIVDSIKTLSGSKDVSKDLEAMLTKNITTASCMTAPKPGPQGAQVTGAPGTPPRPTQGSVSAGPTTLTKGGINSRFENSFVVKQAQAPRGTQATGAPGGQQGGSGQPPQDTNNGQQGRPPQGPPNGAPQSAPNGAQQGAPNGPMVNPPPPQNASPCAGQISALVADLTAFEATLKPKTPASSTPQSPTNGAQGGQGGQQGQKGQQGQQGGPTGPQGQPANGPQGQPPKA